MAMANPEDGVCDEIDRLVNEELAIGPVDDYDVDRYPKCPKCNGSWHGQPNSLGCLSSIGANRSSPRPLSTGVVASDSLEPYISNGRRRRSGSPEDRYRAMLERTLIQLTDLGVIS